MMIHQLIYIEHCFVLSQIEWFCSVVAHSLGKKWHDRRKVITPAFHFNILEKFVEIFDRLGNSVVDKLKQHESNNEGMADDVEFYSIAVLYALDVMCGE